MIDDNYIKSNSTRLPEPTNKDALNRAKAFYKSCREKAEINGQDLQNLSDAVLSMFNMAAIPVKFAGKQPSNTRFKTLGIHKTNAFERSIQVYKFTAKQKKVRSSKGSVDTLLHELTHEFDKMLLNISNSIHCSGFYNRIGQLVEWLNG